MSDPAYRVLARKYRPVDFDGLIGQEVLVRTLSNAIAAGRLAQAYVLTGVRGVGKTTTARILARAFNCIGPDGEGGPTVKPCGVCENCTAIANDRHVDVVEMDAASNNSVDNIREIVEGARYRPSSARYKIYILDEVHMLSNAAFNALLKTLEEPPPHLKFIFATTEIRKVPVTVLSRCQRFDLRRVEAAELADHFAKIAAQENVTVEPAALSLIARAADGSVRDGLSLLDQAIALSDGQVAEEQVRDMLGLADRGVIFDLLDSLLGGDVPAAIKVVEHMHAAGADPGVILNDLLELTHWLTRLKIEPGAATDTLMPEAERARGAAMAAPLSLPVLARLWQLLLKGVGELGQAPSPRLALEMVLIRTAYAANLPNPADLVKQLQEGGGTPMPPPAARAAAPAVPSSPEPVGAMPVPAAEFRAPAPPPAVVMAAVAAVAAPAEPQKPETKAATAEAPKPQPAPEPTPDFSSEPPPMFDEAPAYDAAPYDEPPFDDASGQVMEELPVPSGYREFVTLLEQRRIEPILAARLRTQVRPVSFETGAVTLALEPGTDRDLPGLLRTFLQRLFGGEWSVQTAASSDSQTIAELLEAEVKAEQEAVLAHPLVQATLDTFPGATVGPLRKLALEPAPDDWTALVPPIEDEFASEDESS
ncbi:MAG: DNA polymerase III subunit gamma/tau [Alphaproteobacteria bacterium]|jgi:DNA polymerase-3 subunit gamma/tau